MTLPSSALVKTDDIEKRLFDAAASCAHDPLRYVKMAYPWQEAGTTLVGHAGPDDWQANVLGYIRDNLTRTKPLLIAIAGGNGPGKSTLAAWIMDWGMSTCPDCRIDVTANTGNQLTSRTWPELAKWHRLSLFNSWFELGSRRLRSKDNKHSETWRCDAITWDEHQPEAFAGLHNQGKRIIRIFDEASAIPDVIWDYSEAVLTDSDTEIIWLCLGNPTRSTGRFRMCFPGGRHAGLWWTQKIDTRKSKMANKAQIEEWIKSYGLDSDFVRVRVLSEFPRAGSTQFIASDLVEGAAEAMREPSVTLYDPLVMGVDVARYGDDKSVIRFRRGRDGRTLAPIKFRGMDTMQLSARIGELNELHKPDAIFIDGGGPGGGVVDRCRYLKLPVTEVQFGSSADRSQIGNAGDIGYANKRAEMWGLMKEWLKGGIIDNDPELKADLSAVEYGYVMRDGRDAIMLEKKEDMKKRGLGSPDDGDALALTFAYPVAPTDHSARLKGGRSLHQADYKPFAEAWQTPQR